MALAGGDAGQRNAQAAAEVRGAEVAVTPFQRTSAGEIAAVAVTIWTGSAR